MSKKWGIDGSTPFKTGQLSHLCPKKWHIFCNLLRWFPPIFFSQHQAAFLQHRWRNSRSCAIYVGIPSLILAKWRKLFWASKGRDTLKPNFNKWPEEAFLRSRKGSSGHLLNLGFKASRPLLEKWRKLRHLCPKKDNSDVFPGGFASCPGTNLMSFLVVLPPVLGQLWCLSWWFCLLSWDNSDRCGIFWLGWLMDVGRYEGVAPSMWAFAAWFWRMSGSCAIYAPKRQLDVEKKNGGKPAQCQFSTWVRPGKRTPPSVKFPLGNSGKSSFSDLVGPVFRGQAKWQIARA